MIAMVPRNLSFEGYLSLQSRPAFADWDGDGDPDAVVGNDAGVVVFYRNVGPLSSPAFVLEPALSGSCANYEGSYALPCPVGEGVDDTPFGDSELISPRLVDVDGDGDYDLVTFVRNGTGFRFFQNIGTRFVADFQESAAGANPFQNVNIEQIQSFGFGDLDLDKDMDLIVGEYSGSIRYFRNEIITDFPEFIEQTGSSNPFGEIEFRGMALDVGDVDSDGDADLLLSTEFPGPSFQYFENMGGIESAQFEERLGAANPFLPFKESSLDYLSLSDLDADNDMDLIVFGTVSVRPSGGFPSIKFLKNSGIVSLQLLKVDVGHFEKVDFGLVSNPAMGDLDSDGDLDLVVGNYLGLLFCLKGSGDEFPDPGPADVVAIDGIDVRGVAVPALGDLDGDKDLDLLVGDDQGALHYYRNTGSPSSMSFQAQIGAENPFDNIDLGEDAKPAFVDLDGDADLDLVIGGGAISGALPYYENTGTLELPQFEQRIGSNNPFEGKFSNVRGCLNFTDLDGDGDFDLVMGHKANYHFNDDYTDVIIYGPPSDVEFELSYFENVGTEFSASFSIRDDVFNPFYGVRIFGAAPAFSSQGENGVVFGVVGDVSGGLYNIRSETNCSSPEIVCHDIELALWDNFADISQVGFPFESNVTNRLMSSSVSRQNFTCDELGENTVAVSFGDGLHPPGTCTATVTVIDVTAPVIATPAPMTIPCGEAFVDIPPIASDACDDAVVVSGTSLVNTSRPGEYLVTYRATDASGNVATPVTRLVTVSGACTSEGEDTSGVQSADLDRNLVLSLSELLRIVQFYNSGGLHCAATLAASEDGYLPGVGEAVACAPHDSDYAPQDWKISLSELLRVIQFFNAGGYHACPEQHTEDGYCPEN